MNRRPLRLIPFARIFIPLVSLQSSRRMGQLTLAPLHHFSYALSSIASCRHFVQCEQLQLQLQSTVTATAPCTSHIALVSMRDYVPPEPPSRSPLRIPRLYDFPGHRSTPWEKWHTWKVRTSRMNLSQGLSCKHSNDSSSKHLNSTWTGKTKLPTVGLFLPTSIFWFVLRLKLVISCLNQFMRAVYTFHGVSG